MKLNQGLVEKAINVLSEWQPKYGEKGFPKEMKGDISSFGASIVQAGLLPSVLFFSEGDLTKQVEKTDDNTKYRRACVMQMIFQVLDVEDTKNPFSDKRPLFDYVFRNLKNNNEPEILENITEAALALKLAFRAFKFEDTAAKTSINPATSNP
jgi:CRISPR-associated protein Cmr5